jgi:sarcosine oxidase subunit beta
LPDAAVDDIEFGLFGPDDGYANPKAVLRAMRAIAEDAGVEYIRGDVSAIRRTTNRVTGVAFGTDAIDTPIVVNAAGPFAGRIAELAGVSLLCSRCASNYSTATCPANGSIAFPW